MRFQSQLGPTALASALICATVIGLAGCGRTAVNPAGSDTPHPAASSSAAPDDPGAPPADPGAAPAANPPAGGAPAPAAPANDAPPAARGGGPAPLSPAGALPLKGGAPAAPNPADAQNAFLADLKHFGYMDAGVGIDDLYRDVHLQVVPLMRVPADRFLPPVLGSGGHSPAFLARAREFPEYASLDWSNDAAVSAAEQSWANNAVNLARRNAGVSFMVGSRPLYRAVIMDPYGSDQDGGSARNLVFYKRLNRTNYMVGYTPDGKIFDFGCFAKESKDKRWFLPMPDLYLK